jgi:hypothetical protein
MVELLARDKYLRILLTLLCGQILFTNQALAAQPMKCADGSGRVVYTEESSCAEALRSLPKTNEMIAKERLQKAQQELQQVIERNKTNRLIQQQKLAAERENRERQRRIEEDVRDQRACELKKIELDSQKADAASYPYDSWWSNRAVATQREYALECGH